MKLSDYYIGVDSPISCLAIGATGSGKSIAMCSFPPPIYNANFDGRMGSVANYYRARPELGVDINQIEFDVYRELDPFFDKLADIERYGGYKTLIIDPLTVLCGKMISYNMPHRKGKQHGKIKFSDVEDYGAEINGMRQVLDSLEIIKNTWQMNIILTAHLVTITYNSNNRAKSGDENQQKSERLIVTEGRKLAPKIPILFDEVHHFYVESSFGTVAYKVKTYNDGDVIARTSFANVPGEIDWTNQNYFTILKKYFAEKKPDEVIQVEREGNTSVEVTEGSTGEAF